MGLAVGSNAEEGSEGRHREVGDSNRSDVQSVCDVLRWVASWGALGLTEGQVFMG